MDCELTAALWRRQEVWESGGALREGQQAEGGP